MNTTSSSARERWRQITQEQRDSGLPVTRFCREQRVPASSFFAWKRRLKREGHASTALHFVQLKELKTETPEAGPTTGAMDGGIELHLAGERRLILHRGFDPRTLQAALAVLEQRP